MVAIVRVEAGTQIVIFPVAMSSTVVTVKHVKRIHPQDLDRAVVHLRLHPHLQLLVVHLPVVHLDLHQAGRVHHLILMPKMVAIVRVALGIQIVMLLVQLCIIVTAKRRAKIQLPVEYV